MDEVELTSVDGLALDAVVHRPAPAVRSLGTVVQLHGINAERDEGGMFVRLADALCERGFRVLRFSFRGHGASAGTSRGVTIAGEMLDLEAAVEYARSGTPGPLFIVAASFGAVSTCLSLPWLGDLLSGLVLWNPVLDLRRTFLEPELPWGLENFNAESLDRLAQEGSLLLDGEFELGRTLFAEMAKYDPLAAFAGDSTPSLVIHGDQDSYVSFAIAQQAAEARADCAFHTVVGSDHGFDTREREDEAIAVTVDFLVDQAGASHDG